jgi:hypothetical protein
LEEAEVDGPELHDNIEPLDIPVDRPELQDIEPLDIPGVELEETERNQISIRREDVVVEKRSGVGGLSVDDNYMYYSFTESLTEYEKKCFLRKCEHNGKFVYDVSLPEFVRGIGKDNYGFLYVLCSSTDSKVLKFDEDLNPVRKTNRSCAEHFGVAYGILVTDEHVFVCVRGIGKDNYGFLYVLCSSTDSKVLKFDEDLNPVRKTNRSCAEHFGVAYGILVTEHALTKRYAFWT